MNLTKAGNSDRAYEWPEAQQRTITGKSDRNLCEYDAAAVLAGIEQGRISRVILPWIVLMNGGGEDVIMARWLSVAAAEPDEQRRGDHGGLALVFAELTPHAAAWKQALKGWNVIQSPQILEWQAQARAELKAQAAAAATPAPATPDLLKLVIPIPLTRLALPAPVEMPVLPAINDLNRLLAQARQRVEIVAH